MQVFLQQVRGWIFRKNQWALLLGLKNNTRPGCLNVGFNFLDNICVSAGLLRDSFVALSVLNGLNASF